MSRPAIPLADTAGLEWLARRTTVVRLGLLAAILVVAAVLPGSVKVRSGRANVDVRLLTTGPAPTAGTRSRTT